MEMQEKLLKTAKAELTCSVCLFICPPPTKACKNGHMVCGTCISGIKECPICRALYSHVIGPSRALGMETMAQMIGLNCNCPHAQKGCTESLKYDVEAVKRHLARCNFCDVECLHCKKTILFVNLHDHAMEELRAETNDKKLTYKQADLPADGFILQMSTLPLSIPIYFTEFKTWVFTSCKDSSVTVHVRHCNTDSKKRLLYSIRHVDDDEMSVFTATVPRFKKFLDLGYERFPCWTMHGKYGPVVVKLEYKDEQNLFGDVQTGNPLQ